MKQTTTILAALALSVATAAAGVTTSYSSGKDQPGPAPAPIDPCAGPISYSNIELLYANTDYDFGDSTDGGILRVEYSPMQNFYITAHGEYSDLESDFFRDIWEFSIGLGGYFPLTENIHIALDAGFTNRRYDNLDDNDTFGEIDDVDDDLDDFFDSEDDSGWYARPHLRAKWGCLTVHAGAIYTDYEDNDYQYEGQFFEGFGGDDWSFYVKLYYQFHTNWDVTAGYLNGDNDREQWTVGARYRF